MEHLEKRKDEIIKDFEKGLSLAKLGKHYGCCVNTMQKMLVLWGLKKEWNRQGE